MTKTARLLPVATTALALLLGGCSPDYGFTPVGGDDGLPHQSATEPIPEVYGDAHKLRFVWVNPPYRTSQEVCREVGWVYGGTASDSHYGELPMRDQLHPDLLNFDRGDGIDFVREHKTILVETDQSISIGGTILPVEAAVEGKVLVEVKVTITSDCALDYKDDGLFQALRTYDCPADVCAVSDLAQVEKVEIHEYVFIDQEQEVGPDMKDDDGEPEQGEVFRWEGDTLVRFENKRTIYVLSVDLQPL